MKRIIVFLFSIPFFAHAQQEAYPDDVDSLGLRCVLVYSVDSLGKKLLVRRQTYDTNGHMTSIQRRDYHEKGERIMYDTLIHRNDSVRVSWQLYYSHKQYDSTVTVTRFEGHKHYRITTTWSNGSITYYDSTFSDSINVYSVRKPIGGRYDYSIVDRSHYTYDVQGRVLSREYRDSLYNLNKGYALEHSGYTNEYFDSYSVHIQYEFTGRKKRLMSVGYEFNDPNKADSIIMYDKKGRRDEIHLSESDSSGRIVRYETKSRKGKTLSTWDITYYADSTIQRYYENEDNPGYVRVLYYNKQHLCKKEIKVESIGTRTECFLYEYEFW